MLDVLTAEGITGLQFLAVAQSGVSWEYHVSGYDEVKFPIMSDDSSVYYLYGAVPYDLFLLDKKGRLVTRIEDFSDTNIPATNRRLRQLVAE